MMHFLQAFNTNMESSINFITPLEYIIDKLKRQIQITN